MEGHKTFSPQQMGKSLFLLPKLGDSTSTFHGSGFSLLSLATSKDPLIQKKKMHLLISEVLTTHLTLNFLNADIFLFFSFPSKSTAVLLQSKCTQHPYELRLSVPWTLFPGSLCSSSFKTGKRQEFNLFHRSSKNLVRCFRSLPNDIFCKDCRDILSVSTSVRPEQEGLLPGDLHRQAIPVPTGTGTQRWPRET